MLLDRFNSWFTSHQFIIVLLLHNVSSLNHMRLLYHFSISAKYTSMIDRSLAGFSQLFRPVLMRFEPWRACSNRRSLTDIVRGATLEWPSAKIRSQNL